MAWAIGLGVAFSLALFVFYVFVVVRLISATRDAPPGARSALLSAARTYAANAVQKLGIVAILLFAGTNEAGIGSHAWWMLLVIGLPVVYIMRERRRLSRTRAGLDEESTRFLGRKLSGRASRPRGG